MTSTENKKQPAKKKIEIDNTVVGDGPPRIPHSKDIKSSTKKQANDAAKAKASGKAEEAKSKETKATESEAKSGAESSDEELAILQDKYLRLAAEYKNFRDRSAKERDNIYSDARMDTISRLLPVYDNLERALKMECADEAFYKGVEMTMTGLLEIFESMDVRPIPAAGEPFDPNHHNAVMTIENPKLGSKIVAEELQKGFMLGDKVIRFSTVVVAN